MNRNTRTRTPKPVKITPALKSAQQGVDFADLDDGASFLHNNCLCSKRADGDQEGLDLDDNGQCFFNLCGTYVLPVNVEIKWTMK